MKDASRWPALRRGRTAIARAAGRALHELHVPPSAHGYRLLPSESLGSMAAGSDVVGGRRRAGLSGQLLTNVGQVAVLSGGDDGDRGLRLQVPPRVVALPDSRIVMTPDKWGLLHFAVVSSDGTRVADYTRWLAGHREALRHARPTHVDRAAWVLRSWHFNYYHWVIETLPRLAYLQQHGLDGQVLVPAGFAPPQFAVDSARAVGVELGALRRVEGPLVTVGELRLVDARAADPAMLRLLRASVGVKPRADRPRRLFVSRRRAPRRHLTNEVEVEAALRGLGFETVEFETMSFAEQVQMSRSAEIFVGVHGAGLSNIVFASAPAGVVEIVERGAHQDHYLELARSLGWQYGRVAVANEGGSGSDGSGIHIDPDRLVGLVADVVRRLKAPTP